MSATSATVTVRGKETAAIPPELLKEIHPVLSERLGAVAREGDIPDQKGNVQVGKFPTWDNVHPLVLYALRVAGHPVVVR